MNDMEEEKYCLLCHHFVDKFKPSGVKEEIFEKHHIIGGGYRMNVVCPFCGCGDRERWLYYVATKYTNLSELKGKVLHFAPESSVREFIMSNINIDYYSCDITPWKAMHVADMTDIQFKDSTFDYVISNHVLEHIVDEEKAISEIKRVLKSDGKWILSFPICTDMDTYEDKSIITEQDRYKAYGQEDHVRLYGRDYKERLEKYGLKITIYSPENKLSEEDINKYGFIRDDVIIIAEKI